MVHNTPPALWKDEWLSRLEALIREAGPPVFQGEGSLPQLWSADQHPASSDEIVS